MTNLTKYKTYKKLDVAAKFGEVILVVLLVIKVAQRTTPDDLSYLMGVFLMAIIVVVANVIAVIAEKKALKEIQDALNK